MLADFISYREPTAAYSLRTILNELESATCHTARLRGSGPAQPLVTSSPCLRRFGISPVSRPLVPTSDPIQCATMHCPWFISMRLLTQVQNIFSPISCASNAPGSQFWLCSCHRSHNRWNSGPVYLICRILPAVFHLASLHSWLGVRRPASWFPEGVFHFPSLSSYERQH